jgi:hypothetical protein
MAQNAAKQIPECPIHNIPMTAWRFLAKKESAVQGVVIGYKCQELGCRVIYSEELGDFCKLDESGKPIPVLGLA